MGAFLASSGVAHWLAGRYEDALNVGRRAIEMSPALRMGHSVVVLSLARLGLVEEAREAARPLLEPAGFTVSRYESVSPFKDPALRKQFADLYRSVGVPP